MILYLQTCKWCNTCIQGKCIPQGFTCRTAGTDNMCLVEPETRGKMALTPGAPDCPVKSCIAATCKHCTEQDCLWNVGIPRGKSMVY